MSSLRARYDTKYDVALFSLQTVPLKHWLGSFSIVLPPSGVGSFRLWGPGPGGRGPGAGKGGGYHWGGGGGGGGGPGPESIYMRVYLYIYIYIYICVHTYIHTLRHTYARTQQTNQNPEPKKPKCGPPPVEPQPLASSGGFEMIEVYGYRGFP